MFFLTRSLRARSACGHLGQSAYDEFSQRHRLFSLMLCLLFSFSLTTRSPAQHTGCHVVWACLQNLGFSSSPRHRLTCVRPPHNSQHNVECHLARFPRPAHQNLKPWLIEVNVSCSLASSSPLDKRVKDKLVTDMFHMVGFVPGDRKRAKDVEEEKKRSRLFRGNPVRALQEEVAT